jgi:hypothetical protein
MIQDIGLIVAQIADGVFSEMWVIEGEDLQIGKSVEVEYFFEATNLIAADIEVIKLY